MLVADASRAWHMPLCGCRPHGNPTCLILHVQQSTGRRGRAWYYIRKRCQDRKRILGPPPEPRFTTTPQRADCGTVPVPDCGASSPWGGQTRTHQARRGSQSHAVPDIARRVDQQPTPEHTTRQLSARSRSSRVARLCRRRPAELLREVGARAQPRTGARWHCGTGSGKECRCATFRTACTIRRVSQR